MEQATSVQLQLCVFKEYKKFTGGKFLTSVNLVKLHLSVSSTINSFFSFSGIG